MVPFFVVDRPMSLNIVKTFFVNHPGVSFGLMTRALVSKQFRRLYASFPCDKSACWLRGDKGPCSQKKLCDGAKSLRKAVVKAVDSGIFSEGERPTYPKLFTLYDEMGADYGVMKDTFGDPRKTLESAKRAVNIYERQKREFELVLVAQGGSADQYVTSSERLAALGAGRLALGGLLTRKERSVRYSSAGSLERIDGILGAVRAALPKRWLFVLGCYHPKRHALFEKHLVFGSDYKGWIFNYAHRLDQLSRVHGELVSHEQAVMQGSSMVERAAERSRMWEKAAQARKAYATTKNRSKKDAEEKACHRRILRAHLTDTKNLDLALAEERHQAARQDGVPEGYDRLVGLYCQLVSSTDQEVRVAGVHEYMARKILPNMEASE